MLVQLRMVFVLCVLNFKLMKHTASGLLSCTVHIKANVCISLDACKISITEALSITVVLC